MAKTKRSAEEIQAEKDRKASEKAMRKAQGQRMKDLRAELRKLEKDTSKNRSSARKSAVINVGSCKDSGRAQRKKIKGSGTRAQIDRAQSHIEEATCESLSYQDLIDALKGGDENATRIAELTAMLPKKQPRSPAISTIAEIEKKYAKQLKPLRNDPAAYRRLMANVLAAEENSSKVAQLLANIG